VLVIILLEDNENATISAKYVKCISPVSSCEIPKLLITQITANCGLDGVDTTAFLSTAKKLRRSSAV
jgi:hypothetical protein